MTKKETPPKVKVVAEYDVNYFAEAPEGFEFVLEGDMGEYMTDRIPLRKVKK